MKNILIVFFIVFFILSVLLFPFKTRLMGHFNFIELSGFYSFKIWRIKLLCGRFFRNESGEFEVTNSDNVLSGDYDKNFVNALASQVLSRLSVKKLELFFSGGFVDDSFSSAIMCGTISSSVRSLYSYLSLKYDDVKLFEDIQPTYNESNLELTFDVVVSISLFKLAVSVIKAAVVAKKKERVYER